MLPDAECVKIVAEILTQLDIGDYKIRVCVKISYHIKTHCKSVIKLFDKSDIALV